jgi:CDP-paratose 2-epimerase
VVEWFRPGEHDRVRQALDDISRLGVRRLRTGISWADSHTDEGERWFDWLIPRLAREVELLPCFLYTPPSLGIAARTNSPPREPKAYADFIDTMITRFGDYFEWVELWNEPNNIREWDYVIDNDWSIFSEMVGGAAHWARHRGKKIVLGGLSPVDGGWLDMMLERGLGEHLDAVGFHGFPDTFDYPWVGWQELASRVRGVLNIRGVGAQVWITEAGFSTWRHDEFRQVTEFAELIGAPVDRVYWYALHDLDPALGTVDGFHHDEREYHFGLRNAVGRPKLLFRIWGNGGFNDMKHIMDTTGRQSAARRQKPAVLITGGAGFIGTNLAHRLLETGNDVLIYDNLSRPGVERNLSWLKDTHGNRVRIEIGDVRDPHAVRDAAERACAVYHFAAQVAVTTSLVDPVMDSEVNAGGTLNVLEALRVRSDPPPLVFTSTNKVYGTLGSIQLCLNGTRYLPESLEMATEGVDENCPLDFHSPYGCSKGAADQYVRDYSRTFGMNTVVFRMSCIYGPHQFGTEDQGWVAHFLISSLEGRPLTVYGDGRQVRDILYVGDLVDALLLAREKIDSISGEAFNIGGGPSNTISLIELLDMIEDLHSEAPLVSFEDWRLADQRYYVSSTRRFTEATGWRPRVSVDEGIRLLNDWLMESGDKKRKTQAASGGNGGDGARKVNAPTKAKAGTR